MLRIQLADLQHAHKALPDVRGSRGTGTPPPAVRTDTAPHTRDAHTSAPAVEEAGEAALVSARAAGYAEGHAAGHAEGRRVGHAEGLAEGREAGRAEGGREETASHALQASRAARCSAA